MKLHVYFSVSIQKNDNSNNNNSKLNFVLTNKNYNYIKMYLNIGCFKLCVVLVARRSASTVGDQLNQPSSLF